MNDVNNIITEIASLNPKHLIRVILYGDESFNKELQDTDCIYQIHKRYKVF